MNRGIAAVALRFAGGTTLRRAMLAPALLLLAACGSGGGGGSAPTPPPPPPPPNPDVLAVNGGIAIQSETGRALLSFKPALLAGATYPVSLSFTMSGATGGAACGPGIDYTVLSAANVVATGAALTAGSLTLDAGSGNRQVDVLLCPGVSSIDKQMSFLWNDGASAGTAPGTLRASASTTIELSKRLNDTGVMTCSSASANGLACPQAGLAGQDGETGRDTNPSVTGQGAYRASALALNILPGTTCLQDNVTGLVWEGKVTGGLHDAAATYSWRSAAAANGGAPGTAGGGVCTGSTCDSDSFVAAVNTERHCGFNDWRLPTADELSGIVNSGATAAPTIFAQFINQAAAPYWSASPKAGDVAGAWAVDFNSGAVVAQAKSVANRIRLVRGR